MAPKRSKRTKKRSRPSPESTQTIPFSSFPREVINLIFSYVDDYDQEDVFSFIQVSRDWYTQLIPKLYRKLSVHQDNTSVIFRSLDLTMDDPSSDCSDSDIHHSSGENSDEEEAAIVPQEHGKRTVVYGKHNKTHDEKTQKGKWQFGLTSEDASQRKLEHLQHVKSLKIVDWKGGKAIAAILSYSDSPAKSKLKPFCQVESLAFGLKFLNSREFYPDCACETQPRQTEITRQLGSLRPKHVCFSWKPSAKFHPEEDGFDDYIGFLINKYKSQLISFTWHGMNNSTLFPWFPQTCPTIRLFCEKCGHCNPRDEFGGLTEQGVCQCPIRLKEMTECVRSAAKKNKENSLIEGEIINLSCLGDVLDENIDEEGQINGKNSGSNSKYKKGNDLDRQFENNKKPFIIRVTSSAKAEACVCCWERT